MEKNGGLKPFCHKKGGFIVPGRGSGDRVPMNLSPGDFVLNKRATAAAGLQRGGTVPTLLEPGEAVIPKSQVTPDIVNLNKSISRFQRGGYVPNYKVKLAANIAKHGAKYLGRVDKIKDAHGAATASSAKDVIGTAQSAVNLIKEWDK